MNDKRSRNSERKGLLTSENTASTNHERNRSRSRSNSSRSSSSELSISSTSSASSSSSSSKYKRREKRRSRKHHTSRGKKFTDSETKNDREKVAPGPKFSSISFGKSGAGMLSKVTPVQMKLSAQKKQIEPTKKIPVAAVFNNDSDDEVEQMPAECRMRMRNIGRDTPTSSGPNSFGKTKQGFCDAKKIFEKNLRHICDD